MAVVPGLDPSGIDLLSVCGLIFVLHTFRHSFEVSTAHPWFISSQKMLCLDPSRRITARTALGHEYFKDLGLVP